MAKELDLTTGLPFPTGHLAVNGEHNGGSQKEEVFQKREERKEREGQGELFLRETRT